MACWKLSSTLMALLLAIAAGPGTTRPVAAATSAHLHFYMHDVTGGPSPTAVRVVNGPRGSFGNTVVIDDELTEGTSQSSATVGRAQGYYMVASVSNLELMVNMNVELADGGGARRRQHASAGALSGRRHGAVQDGARLRALEDRHPRDPRPRDLHQPLRYHY
ncbi:dirigent protein 21-like [Panicum miliaceum]|uniref:Dirigent protein n=1 Tax=Panicum miliaceum TaxID=4540 RepID=A0A3L6SA71_PANMI|nr:dirigent protein 21-like [Panicum miliaceum]